MECHKLERNSTLIFSKILHDIIVACSAFYTLSISIIIRNEIKINWNKFSQLISRRINLYKLYRSNILILIFIQIYGKKTQDIFIASFVTGAHIALILTKQENTILFY